MTKTETTTAETGLNMTTDSTGLNTRRHAGAVNPLQILVRFRV